MHGDATIANALTLAAPAHVQFETSHSFPDSHGRVGHLRIALLLSVEGALRELVLYLSLFLKQHLETYYELLQKARIEGGWAAWLFFFQGRLPARSGNSTKEMCREGKNVRDRKHILSVSAPK